MKPSVHSHRSLNGRSRVPETKENEEDRENGRHGGNRKNKPEKEEKKKEPKKKKRKRILPYSHAANVPVGGCC